MIKSPESNSIIRFQDCDPFGHLNNSKYIDYMFNAREDQLIKNYNLNIFQMAQVDKKAWVSGKSEIIYLKPAFVMEKVVIQTRLIDYSAKYVQAEMVMFDLHKTHVKSVLWGKFFHYDLKTNKGIEHSDEHMELFKTLHMPIVADNLDDRAFNVAKQLKTNGVAQRVI